MPKKQRGRLWLHYGVFQKLPDGGICWVAVVDAWKEPEQRLRELRLASAAEVPRLRPSNTGEGITWAVST